MAGTNISRRIINHPDTNEELVLLMSEEDWIAGQANAQVYRDAIAAAVAAETARQTDLDEVRAARVTAALTQVDSDEQLRQTDENAVDSDIAGLTAQNAVPTLQRVLAREKRARNREARALIREKLLIKAVNRIVDKLA